MKAGDRVFCKDIHGGFVGWIKSIHGDAPYAYTVVKNREELEEQTGGDKMSKIRKALENENVSEDKIKKVLKELGIKESKRWNPGFNEEYWTVSNDGEVWKSVWIGDRFDLHSKLTDNMFKTKQEARDHRDKIYFLAEMKMDFEDNSDEIDWSDDNQKKHIVCFDHLKNEIAATWWSTTQQNALYTTNREWLEQYIVDNEENIKKYYFGIE